MTGLFGAGALGAVRYRASKRSAVSLQSAFQVLNDLPETGRLPAVFVGHGTPWAAIRPGEFAETWSQIGRALPRPEAILMVSAHWITQGQTLVTGSEAPRMNYDMYGFPAEMYQIRYSAPGAPDLAEAVGEALGTETPVGSDTAWGFDHGTWLPLMYMFPGAPVPLIQLSVDYSRPPEFHLELGRGLRDLRARGVMLMGSGNLVHNLRQRGTAGSPPFAWAEEFDSAITTEIEDGDYKAVARFLDLGALARAAHPTHDHFLPLLYVLGARVEGESVSMFNARFQEPSVSMKSFVIA